jgi:hypothetical protein
MSDALAAVTHVWPWIASTLAVLGAAWRWWRSRSLPPRRSEPFDTEEIVFPRASPSSPGRGLARWLSLPLRLALKEAGEQAMNDEMAGLRDDLKRTMADNRRLRAELDGRTGSDAGSTATDTASRQPSRRPRPDSSR